MFDNAKKILTICLASSISISAAMTSMAGTWIQDSVGWWYDNGDGTYQKDGWFQDTDSTWYYFNPSGYMLADTTTPDGYKVNASGAWITTASTEATSTTDTTDPNGNYFSSKYVSTSYIQADGNYFSDSSYTLSVVSQEVAEGSAPSYKVITRLKTPAGVKVNSEYVGMQSISNGVPIISDGSTTLTYVDNDIVTVSYGSYSIRFSVKK